VLFFLMANTVYAALRLLVGGGAEPDWTDGVVVGAAMTSGLVVAFMPAETAEALPAVLKPLAGNAFVVGLAVALALEHLLLRRPR
jgi:xanthine/uracil permease